MQKVFLTILLVIFINASYSQTIREFSKVLTIAFEGWTLTTKEEKNYIKFTDDYVIMQSEDETIIMDKVTKHLEWFKYEEKYLNVYKGEKAVWVDFETSVGIFFRGENKYWFRLVN